MAEAGWTDGYRMVNRLQNGHWLPKGQSVSGWTMIADESVAGCGCW